MHVRAGFPGDQAFAPSTQYLREGVLVLDVRLSAKARGFVFQ